MPEPTTGYARRNADLRPGVVEGRTRDHPLWPAHRAGRHGRGESKAPERRLCHGQHNSDPNVEAFAESGMGSREARKRQARAPVQSRAGGQAKTDGGATVLGVGGTPATPRAWTRWLEKHEAHGIATDGGRGDGLKNIVRHIRCIYI